MKIYMDSVSLKEILHEKRIDASPFVSKESLLLRKLIKTETVKLKVLVSIHKVKNRNSRVYVSNSERGYPYLSNTDMVKADSSGVKYISKKAITSPNEQLTQKNDILISAVGTIGMIALIRKDTKKHIVSGNILRVTPIRYSGFIYSYLMSSYGQAALNKMASGSVQDFITPPKLGNLPIPLLPEAQQQHIHNLIEKAAVLREEANVLLREAKTFFDDEFSFEVKKTSPKMVNYKSLMEFQCRFDSTFHLKKIINNSHTEKIKKYSQSVFVGGRDKRVYVEDGIPFLSSSNMMLYNPLKTSKKISKNSSMYEKALIEEDWILISRSGTVGNVAIVRKNWNKITASEHCLRLVIDETLISPYYVFAYLSSNHGKANLERGAFGSVILTLNEEFINELEIPILEDNYIKKIHSKIDTYIKNLDQAETLENQAISELENTITSWQN
jgi:type I restriction enzyme S subunit